MRISVGLKERREMANLKTMQVYANKCAERLGVTDNVLLRWSGGVCKCKPRENAHCHTADGTMPRGTICIKPGSYRLETIKGWHYLIAHEVSHLATKCSHSSYTFARRMESLGQASSYEKDYLRTRRKHHHVYSVCRVKDGVRTLHCHYCLKAKPK